MTATVAAALLVGVAVLLAAPLPAAPAPGRDGRARSARSGRPRVLVLAAATVAGLGLGAALGVLEAGTVVLVVTAAATVAGVLGLAGRSRRRRAAQQLADQVLEACTALADELRAGRSPERALELAARDCPELEVAVRAARLGADVPAALRRGSHPDLRLLAAAWQVSHRTGEGLAATLGRVAEGLAAARTTRRVVTSELASARSTARLLVALPAVALLAGAGGGGRPWEFLLGTVPGTACLVAGLGLGLGGLWWIEGIAADVETEL